MKKRILIVVDMQYDFIYGTLGTKEAVEIIPKVKQKIEEYRKDGHIIIYTRDTHYENYLETQEGRNLPVLHCIKGTKGWEIIPELDTTDCQIMDKPIFGSVNLMTYLEKSYPEADFELVGLCTDICVLSNATMIKSHFPEAEVIVDADCCAGVTAQRHKIALEAMKCIQITIMNEK